MLDNLPTPKFVDFDHTSANSLQHHQTAVQPSFQPSPVSQAKLAVKGSENSRPKLRTRLGRDLEAISNYNNVYTSIVMVTITVSRKLLTATDLVDS